MKCDRYKQQISLMIDGELGAALFETLSVHLEGCSECREFRERLITVNNAVKNASPVIFTPNLAARVKERLPQTRTRQPRSDFIVWARVPVMALVALLALGLGNLAGRSINEFLSNGTMASIELIAPDNDGSFSDVLLDAGVEENR